MRRFAIAAALVAAATATAWASNSDAPYGAGGGQRFDARVTLVNAPGGAYIQCDPRNPSSPVRCKPDGW
jgi:hypothetical protein